MQRDVLLEKFNPDPDSLLKAISKHIDDSMLMSIASADYEVNVDLNFEQLCKIRDGQGVLAPMPWNPKEVLELTRWEEPEKMSLSPHMQLQRHTIRAFVCAALLRAIVEPLNDGYFGGDNDIIAPLLASLSFLDMKVQKEALRFFAWCAQHLPPYDPGEVPFYLFALLIVFLRIEKNILRIELKMIIGWIYEQMRVSHITEFLLTEGIK